MDASFPELGQQVGFGLELRREVRLGRQANLEYNPLIASGRADSATSDYIVVVNADDSHYINKYRQLSAFLRLSPRLSWAYHPGIPRLLVYRQE
jgi:hypothetical protein